MARPQKSTVDYFPLDCQLGDSINAIENIFGNDGFVVWIKLLQKLGRTEYHYIDIRNSVQKALFISIFKIPKERVLEILDMLASLECIDSELWKYKIIYSQNFVNRISDAYRNRKNEILTREAIFVRNGVSGVRNLISDVRNPINDVSNPQTKLKETKLNKTKENKIISLSEKREEITEEEREILINYINKECNARNQGAYLTKMLENGSYKTILKQENSKIVNLQETRNNIRNDYNKVSDKITASIFIGKYANQIEVMEKQPIEVIEIMQKYNFTDFDDVISFQREFRKNQKITETL